MKVKLIHNWKRAWKYFSVQADLLAVAITGSWLAVPADMRASIPSDWLAMGALFLAVLGVIGRLVKQDD